MGRKIRTEKAAGKPLTCDCGVLGGQVPAPCSLATALCVGIWSFKSKGVNVLYVQKKLLWQPYCCFFFFFG